MDTTREAARLRRSGDTTTTFIEPPTLRTRRSSLIPSFVLIEHEVRKNAGLLSEAGVFLVAGALLRELDLAISSEFEVRLVA
jgi:hypothetical protein